MHGLGVWLRVLALLCAGAAAAKPIRAQQSLTMHGCRNATAGMARVRVDYRTTDGKMADAVSFSIKYNPSEFRVVEQSSALTKATCQFKTMEQAAGEVAFTCASFNAQAVVPPTVNGIVQLTLIPLHRGRPTTPLQIVPNRKLKVDGFTYASSVPLAVRDCAQAVVIPTGASTARLLANLRENIKKKEAQHTANNVPGFGLGFGLGSVRGGNSPGSQDDDGESPTEWQALVQAEKELVKQVEERQAEYEKSTSVLKAHQAALVNATDAKAKAKAKRAVSQQSALVVQAHKQMRDAAKLHIAVLRKMNVPESSIMSIHNALNSQTLLPPGVVDPKQPTAWAAEKLGSKHKRECNPPAVPGDGYRAAWTTNKIGAKVRFACNFGFFLIGSLERTCLSTLQWSGTPTFCEPFTKAPTPAPTPPPTPPPTPEKTKQVLCPVPVMNPHVQFSLTTRVAGGVMHFNCDNPYLLIGPSTAVCSSSGEWGTFPACVRSIKKCSHIRCRLRKSRQSALVPPTVAVFYDRQEQRGTRHHCQFRSGSTNPNDCTCWCWFDNLDADEQARRQGANAPSYLSRPPKHPSTSVAA